MKRIAIAAAAAFVMLGTAQAQPVSPWYGELGYSFMKIDAAGTSARPGALRGIIGFGVHPMLAVEGMLGGGVVDSDKDVDIGGGVIATTTVKLKSMYGIFAKPRYISGPFEGYARLGWAHTKVSSESLAAVLNTTQSDDDFAWGLGANYSFNPRVYVGADWMRYSNQSNHKVDGLTLSVGYRW